MSARSRACVCLLQVWFKTIRTLVLGTLFEIFCERMGADLGAVRFMHKVRRRLVMMRKGSLAAVGPAPGPWRLQCWSGFAARNLLGLCDGGPPHAFCPLLLLVVAHGAGSVRTWRPALRRATACLAMTAR